MPETQLGVRILNVLHLHVCRADVTVLTEADLSPNPCNQVTSLDPGSSSQHQNTDKGTQGPPRSSRPQDSVASPRMLGTYLEKD